MLGNVRYETRKAILIFALKEQKNNSFSWYRWHDGWKKTSETSMGVSEINSTYSLIIIIIVLFQLTCTNIILT